MAAAALTLVLVLLLCMVPDTLALLWTRRERVAYLARLEDSTLPPAASPDEVLSSALSVSHSCCRSVCSYTRSR